MNKYDLFDLWAPADSPWSPWVKPAPFVHLPPEFHPETAMQVHELAGIPSAQSGCAVLLDLAGADSVAAGLALASRGYRPVPLFNACPPPIDDNFVRKTVDVDTIVEGLVAGAVNLAMLELTPAAPPAFLVDVDRSRILYKNQIFASQTPRTFDNRSVVFASDFPSAAFLREHGITRVMLVHSRDRPFGNDLRHALRHWSAAGVQIDMRTEEGVGLDVRWPGNSIWGELLVRISALLRFRKNEDGSFGNFPPPSAGG